MRRKVAEGPVEDEQQTTISWVARNRRNPARLRARLPHWRHIRRLQQPWWRRNLHSDQNSRLPYPFTSRRPRPFPVRIATQPKEQTMNVADPIARNNELRAEVRK